MLQRPPNTTPSKSSSASPNRGGFKARESNPSEDLKKQRYTVGKDFIMQNWRDNEREK